MKLGDLVEKIIRVITLGQGKKIATRIAKLRGKEDCGCDRRQQKLNNLSDNIFKFTEVGTQSSINVSWKEEWKEIRKQVSCSCNFVEGIVEIKDANGALIKNIKFDRLDLLNGTKRNITLEYPSKATPVIAEIKYKQKEGEFTTPVIIKI